MKEWILLVIYIVVWQTANATERDTVFQMVEPDSVTLQKHIQEESIKHNIPYMGLGFVAAGFMTGAQKHNFRHLRHYYQPNFKSKWDDYTQYTPLAATWILKSCGVEGRSSWGRLAVSNALSGLTMALLVNSLKHTTKELRPDGTSYNSFPSGHTATSFVCATILHREYGMTRSPWYSIAGYSVATATGVFRILNNRHWINDVLVGAGIGIISTDIGYLVGDLIFKHRGIKHNLLSRNMPNLLSQPSFLSVGVQMGIGPNSLNCPPIYDDYDENMHPFAPGDESGESHPLGLQLYLGHSSSLNVECAYFMNKYIGFGGRIRATAIPVTATVNLDNGFEYDVKTGQRGANIIKDYIRFAGVESNHIGMFDFNIGPYLAYPVNKNFGIGAKLLIGNRLTTDYRVDAIVDLDINGIKQLIESFNPNDKNIFEHPEEKQELLNLLQRFGDGKGIHNKEFMSIKANNSPVFSTGLSLTWAYKLGMAFRINLDYDYSHPEYIYHLKNRWQEGPGGEIVDIVDTFRRSTSINNLSLGLGMTLFF